SEVDVSFSCDASSQIQNPTVNTVQFTPKNLPAAPLPANFVLRTITCDTPLYETAGGQVIPGGAAVPSGQTWYVNPKPVDANGTSWTELFDSSYNNGWLPTSCVGGAPAGWTGG